MSSDTAVDSPDVLVGVDPEDTLEVKYKGAKFQLGVIPSGIWQRIMVRRTLAVQESVRRTIARMRTEGKDPDALRFTKEKHGFDATEAVVQSNDDLEYRRVIAALQLEAVSYGVKGHENFANRKRETFPFILETVTVEGEELQQMGRVTRKIYGANLFLLELLFTKLLELNDFEVISKKD